MNRKRLGAAALSLVGLTVVAACGSSSSGHGGHDMSMMTNASSVPGSTMSGSQQASFNDADVQFATQMIPHHEQAVQMSRLAASRALSPEVKALADRIEKAQAPEIEQMSTWLRAWGKPVPSSMAGHDMGPMTGMPGMMSTQEMSDLMAANGAGFDRMFLTMMIAHHEGAVQMARTELAEGANADAKKLAQQIVTSQTAEIATMKKMLG
ncbi:DUF305 domain-containing protein [Branchiibius sp. NY16-3462-2]|uniref:DUF305 domain-containing protein n=1 Tax=Branchiibius sp. NY16-3462-2 TaxID=1807500 RepID=UPI0007957CB4|nr:DUF305 domain-containing protein [Branchiibius sp. NY16-3462-2]KYH45930.1 hypothetical protein AZH51_09650 [Branchiibius sp. NY16-3462-2]